MLPALPAIGEALGVKTANERQLVVTAFLIGFGVAQLAHGPLADRFGRKPVLGVALAAYVIATFVAAVSASFELLLIARFIGGTAIADSPRVTLALGRDCFSVPRMGRGYNLGFIVF